MSAQFAVFPITSVLPAGGDIVKSDVDGDGDMDIVSVLFLENTVVWYENKGGGKWSLENLISNTTSPPLRVYSVDLDNDGDMDVISTEGFGSGNKLAWYENFGGGVFGLQNILDQGSAANNVGIVSVDIDNDGDNDIITSSWNTLASGNNGAAWYENFGNGIFSTAKFVSTSLGDAVEVYAADMDNDQDLDIISVTYNYDRIAWHENLGAGIFSSTFHLINTPDNDSNSSNGNGDADGVRYAAIGDLDFDGDLDVISASNLDNKIAWYENLGGGVFGPQQIVLDTTLSQTHFVMTTDMDGDLDLDILYGSSTKTGWFENTGSTFSLEHVITLNSEVNEVANIRIDYDGDGDLDIVNGNGLGLYENLGLNTYANPKRLIKFVHDYFDTSVDAADFDGDGKMDIVTGFKNEIYWYQNESEGEFSMQRTISTSMLDITFVYACDIDNDGDSDVLVSSISNDLIGYFENLGGGNFDTTVNIISTQSGWATSVYAKDLDGDLDLDVLSTSLSGLVIWHENLGGGNIDTTKNIISSSADGAKSVFAIDLDNDGDADVLSASENDDKIAWYENLGSGVFGSQQVIAVADGAKSVYSIDIDGDLDNDVVFASANDNTISWIENQGGGSFGLQQVISNTIAGARSVFAIDLDADGDNEIIATSAIANQIFWFDNLGGGIFQSKSIITNSNVDAHYAMAEDMDADGDPDILCIDKRINLIENFNSSIYRLKGNFFGDINQNGIFDNGEVGLSLQKVHLSPSGLINYSNSLGDYVLSTPDTGYFTINHFFDTLWNLTTDSNSFTIQLTSSNPVIDSLNFGFYPDSSLTLIMPSLTAGFPRCNDTILFTINIHNEYTTLPSGSIHLLLDDSIGFITSNIFPDSINGKNIYWHYDSLPYLSDKQVVVSVIMPPATTIGDTLLSFITVHQLDTAGNVIYTNTDSLEQESRCSYDPNDKRVRPQGLDVEGFILKDGVLDYLIRFQNTGNDTAITVMVRDQLDINLDWNSLQPIASSDSMQIWIEQDGEAVFRFNNIMLPDSNTSELASHGFVRFKIDMKPNLPPGTIIKNTGHIYFDANPAVITNQEFNTIYDCDFTIINTVSTTLCLGENLFSHTPESDVSDVFWVIDSFHSTTNDTLNWLTDTVGSFNLKLTINNALCSKDTIVPITVLPAILITNRNNIICHGDSVWIGGMYRKTTGTFLDTLISYLGCDSIMSIDLIVLPSYNFIQNASICQGDSILLYGIYQNSSGIYYDSLQTITGCDSILSTTLTVTALPTVTILPFSPDSICANGNSVVLPVGSPIGGNYTGTGVGGGNFNPTAAGVGTHNVIYTYTDGNSCINSDTTVITVEVCVGINETTNNFGILIYPNPNTGLFTIEKPADLNKEVMVKLLDATSKLILEKTIPVGQQKVEMNITKYSNGIYYLQLIVDDEVFVKQILKD